jgi:hypothetical protein
MGTMTPKPSPRPEPEYVFKYSPFFTPRDFRDPIRFSEKLLFPDSPIAIALGRRLSQDFRKCRATLPPGAPMPDDAQQLLCLNMNRMLVDVQLFREVKIEPVWHCEKSSSLACLSEKSMIIGRTIRLNRFLLEGAFTQDIVRARERRQLEDILSRKITFGMQQSLRDDDERPYTNAFISSMVEVFLQACRDTPGGIDAALDRMSVNRNAERAELFMKFVQSLVAKGGAVLVDFVSSFMRLYDFLEREATAYYSHHAAALISCVGYDPADKHDRERRIVAKFLISGKSEDEARFRKLVVEYESPTRKKIHEGASWVTHKTDRITKQKVPKPGIAVTAHFRTVVKQRWETGNPAAMSELFGEFYSHLLGDRMIQVRKFLFFQNSFRWHQIECAGDWSRSKTKMAGYLDLPAVSFDAIANSSTTEESGSPEAGFKPGVHRSAFLNDLIDETEVLRSRSENPKKAEGPIPTRPQTSVSKRSGASEFRIDPPEATEPPDESESTPEGVDEFSPNLPKPEQALDDGAGLRIDVLLSCIADLRPEDRVIIEPNLDPGTGKQKPRVLGNNDYQRKHCAYWRLAIRLNERGYHVVLDGGTLRDSALLLDSDVLDRRVFLFRIQDETDLVSFYLRSRFCPAAKKKLDAYRPPRIPSRELIEAVLDDINKVIKGPPLDELIPSIPSLLNEDAFRHIERTFHRAATVLYNRLILEEWYDGVFERIQDAKPWARLLRPTNDKGGMR